VLLVFLGGCGASNQPQSTKYQPTPLSNSPTPSPLSNSPTPSPQPGSIFFQKENLNVYSPAGFNCFSYDNLGQPGNDGKNLVLATDRLTYDAKEVQQIVAYMTKGGPLPNTLRYVSGGPRCTLSLQITNLANKAVTLQRLQIRLLNSPRKNTMEYHLIDECEFFPNVACPGLAGGPLPILGFSLENGSVPAGTVFAPKLQRDDTGNVTSSSTPVVIPTKGIAYFYIEVVSGAPIPYLEHGTTDSFDLIYDIVPELVLATEGSSRTVSLTPLKSTLFFASSKHTGCYTLKGNTFVKAPGFYVPATNTYCG